MNIKIKEKQAKEVAKRLQAEYPNPKTELDFDNERELVLAVMLSAQTTDKKVNEITKKLFKEYPSWEVLAKASPEEVQETIYGVNYHKTKAERLVKTANKILEDFNRTVPRNIKDLTTLPGIARKSANVILQELWDIAEGIVVDTHVKRVSNRLGLVDSDRPKKIEKELMDLLPQDYWRNFSGAMVLHGRYICTARSPQCEECFLNDICPSAFSFED